MTDLPSHRRFDEEEVRRLLERTAELQSAAPPAPTSGTGLTLHELEGIAAEAGLDVSLLRQAAAEVDAAGRVAPPGLGTKLAGAPVRLVIERTLPFETDESILEDLVPIIEMAASRTGHAARTGRGLTWSNQGAEDPSGLHVAVTIVSGETLIRIEERSDSLAWGLFGGALGGGFGLGAGATAIAISTGGPVALIALPAVVMAGFYAGARAIFRRVRKGQRPRLEELLEKIVGVLIRSRPAD